MTELRNSEIIKKSDGSTFKTAQAAGAYLKHKCLSPDTHKVEPAYGEEGFVIRGPGLASTQGKSEPAGSHEMKYLKVRFMPKAKPDDTDDVQLGVNGEYLVCERGKTTILPESYVEVARNAMTPHYMQQPGQPRKVVAEVQTYPFEVLGPSTKEEFEALRKAGTNKMLAEMQAEEAAKRKSA